MMLEEEEDLGCYMMLHDARGGGGLGGGGGGCPRMMPTVKLSALP